MRFIRRSIKSISVQNFNNSFFFPTCNFFKHYDYYNSKNNLPINWKLITTSVALPTLRPCSIFMVIRGHFKALINVKMFINFKCPRKKKKKKCMNDAMTISVCKANPSNLITN